MTQQELVVQALGSAQLMIINMRVEIESLKDKIKKLEKLNPETKTAE